MASLRVTFTPQRAHPSSAELPRVSCTLHSRAWRTAVLGNLPGTPQSTGQEPEPHPVPQEPPHLSSCQYIGTTQTFSGRNAIKLEAIFKRQLEQKYIYLERINTILNEFGAKEGIIMEIECLQLNINKNSTSIFKCSTFN